MPSAISLRYTLKKWKKKIDKQDEPLKSNRSSEEIWRKLEVENSVLNQKLETIVRVTETLNQLCLDLNFKVDTEVTQLSGNVKSALGYYAAMESSLTDRLTEIHKALQAYQESSEGRYFAVSRAFERVTNALHLPKLLY